MRYLLLLSALACGGPSGGPGSAADDTHTLTGDPTDAGGTTQAPARLTPTDLITSVPYTGLRVEIDYVAGKGPDPEALALVEAELQDLQAGGYLTKASIELVLDEELPAVGAGPHTFETLDAVLKDHAGPVGDGGTAVIHALYTDGSYEADEGSSRVLGFAYGGGYLVMLHDNIDAACEQFAGPLLGGLSERTCEIAEATVLMHEIGHLFGLVDNGLPMVEDHKDPENGDHDVSADCLMYWAVERTEVVESIADAVLAGDESIKPLDPACLADMAAAQAR